jgi:hypothetical protein
MNSLCPNRGTVRDVLSKGTTVNIPGEIRTEQFPNISTQRSTLRS